MTWTLPGRPMGHWRPAGAAPSGTARPVGVLPSRGCRGRWPGVRRRARGCAGQCGRERWAWRTPQGWRGEDKLQSTGICAIHLWNKTANSSAFFTACPRGDAAGCGSGRTCYRIDSWSRSIHEGSEPIWCLSLTFWSARSALPDLRCSPALRRCAGATSGLRGLGATMCKVCWRLWRRADGMGAV